MEPRLSCFLDYEYFLHYLSAWGVERCLIQWQPLVNYIQSSTGVIGSSSYREWAMELDAILHQAPADYSVLDAGLIHELDRLRQRYEKKAEQSQIIPAFQS
jgi:hypothetical protein